MIAPPVTNGKAAHTVAAALTTVATDLNRQYPQYPITKLVARIDEHATSIDNVYSAEGLTPTNKAVAIGKLVFAENCIDVTSPGYNDEREVNWSTQCRLPAAAYVKPGNPIEVAVAVKIITLTGTKFNTRALGNNPNPTWGSASSDGIVIDLTLLKTLELDADQKVAHVGPGNKIGEVQKYMDDYPIGVVTGVNNRVGVSGAILGGGFPPVNGSTGLACDHVKNYEIVLGDSTIVNANAEEHPDLFQCMKGGGNNFGIVTRLDLYTVPVHNMWYYFFDVPNSKSKEFLAALAEVQGRLEKDPRGSFIAIASGPVWHLTLHYDGHSDVIPWVFEPVTALPPMDTPFFIPPTNGTVYSYNCEMTPKQPHIGRQPCALTTKIDAQLYYDIFLYWEKNFPQGKGQGMDLCFKPFTGHSVKAGQVHGTKNIINNTEVPQTWWSMLAQWADPADKEELYDCLEGLVDYMVNQAKATDNLLPYTFMNDGGWMQDVTASYGAKSVATMKAVSRKYDPKQVFQKLQTGGWKVSKSDVKNAYIAH